MNIDFGYKHLTGLAWLLSLIIATLTILLVVKRKKNLGEKYDRAVIRYTCYFMWTWEIIKTFRMINFADYGPVGYYPLWMAPFHICSMGLYAYLIVGSKHPGKLSEWVKPFAYAVLMLVTSLILIIPASSGILGSREDWSFTFENLLPYQSFLYHGCLLFVSLYMVLSGFYRPKWSDIPKGIAVLFVVAAFAQGLNYSLDGSGADFMTLRYGNGNPFAFLLQGEVPILYHLVLTGIAVGGVSLIIAITIGAYALVDKLRAKRQAVTL